MKIQSLTFHVLHVSAKTNWSFVRVETHCQRVGWGECSLNGWEMMQREYCSQFSAAVVGREIATTGDVSVACKLHLHSPGGLIEHSVKSATEQALLDVLAQRDAVPLWALFGGQQRRSVEVYANINRATNPRTPAGFAASAREAVAAGFGAIKLAPFDGVLPRTAETEAGAALINAALARIRAVRDAVGFDVKLMVDCHWRLTPTTALRVLDALRDVKLHWLECPISEQPQWHAEIRAIRDHANAQNVRLAGAEMQSELEGFRPFIEGGLYDTIMPDVKYCGGVAALLRIAELAAKHHIQTAPHNPTGPLCNFASLHACVAGVGCDFLELQVGESELFTRAVHDATPGFQDGHYLAPAANGIGAQLDGAVLAARPYAPVSGGLDPSLG
ncbi:MAG: mandelate racemase/muconate lactonizing enzyme family protein [Burkholderiales bacterium]|nr:mandelate racemase/muconate lactonizing enzyme family protein [Burkholderiales bacterium]